MKFCGNVIYKFAHDDLKRTAVIENKDEHLINWHYL